MIEQPIEDESIWPVWKKCAELDTATANLFGGKIPNPLAPYAPPDVYYP